MNFNLDYRGFEENLAFCESLHGGVHYEFHFDNGFGAGVIKHNLSYGHEVDLWELAVLMMDTTDHVTFWDLCYTTPITDDVVGRQTDEQIRELLKRIKEL